MARPRHPDLPRLAERLEALRSGWHGRRLDSDPLLFPHRFPDRGDREVVAFLAASLAFGRVASIRASVERLLAALGKSPTAFLDAWDERPIPEFAHFVHRWVTGEDVEEFLRMVKRARHAHGSLGALFEKGDDGGSDFVAPLSSFHGSLHSFSARPTADLAAAREATSWLSRLSPLDPVGYDWALSRLGILAECVRERTRRHCERCALAPVCRERIGPPPTKGLERVLTA